VSRIYAFMAHRRLQPGFAIAGLGCVVVGVFWLARTPLPYFLFLLLSFAALTWLAFDAGGLPACEPKLNALLRGTVIFYAVAAFSLIFALYRSHPSEASLCLFPIVFASFLLWERSRLARALRPRN
jgi:hypothetical protein